MRTIYKYPLTCTPDEQQVKIPGWGGVAYVANQFGFANEITVWCHVDTDKPMYLARFVVIGTGHPAPSNDFIYCGSGITEKGLYVWHVFRNAVTEKLD